MQTDWLNALIGGAIIGLAVNLMLLLNGRVTGIAGIVGMAITPKKNDFLWRFLFVLGLVVGGYLMFVQNPANFDNSLGTQPSQVIVAGLLVGFGSLLGSGCTSGHGVCGISRFSVRSLLATVVFISAGVLAVFLLRQLGVLQ